MRDQAAPPYLTDAEVDDICAGLTQSAAKCRFFTEVLQVPVRRKPNGRPLVLRADVERAAAPDDPAPRGRTIGASNEPNWQRKAAR
jgi:hypothetical protein